MRTEQVTVDGISFQLLPMPLMEARKWDAKVLMVLAPLLGALDAFGPSKAKKTSKTEEAEGDEPAIDAELAPDAEPVDEADESEKPAEDDTPVDFAKLTACFQKALSALPDETMNALVRGMFARVTCLPLEGSPFVINTDKNVDAAFEGCGPISMYKLMFEVARFNKFTPFAVAGAGTETGGILASLVPAGARKGLNLARLAGSTAPQM